MILFQVGVIVSRAIGAGLIIMAVCSLLSMLPVMDIMAAGWGGSSATGSANFNDTYYFVSNFSYLMGPLAAQSLCGLFLIFGSRITARWLIKGMENSGEDGGTGGSGAPLTAQPARPPVF